MDQQTRITLDSNILVGKPIIRGTRIAVEFVIDLLAHGWSTDEILRNYPGLSLEDIHACLSYASTVLKWQRSPYEMIGLDISASSRMTKFG